MTITKRYEHMKRRKRAMIALLLIPSDQENCCIHWQEIEAMTRASKPTSAWRNEESHDRHLRFAAGKDIHHRHANISDDSHNHLQNEIVEVVLNYHVLHALHRNLQQIGVRCVGEMNVDFLVPVAVKITELLGEELGSCGEIFVGTLVVGEVVFHWALLEFLLEQVDLIEKEDNRAMFEPRYVDDGFEEHNCFLHLILRCGQCQLRHQEGSTGIFAQTYRSLVLYQALVIATESNKEHQTLDAFEAMDPFLALRTLATNIKHIVGQFAKFEDSFGYTSCAETGAQHVLVVGHIVLGKEAVDVPKEAVIRVNI